MNAGAAYVVFGFDTRLTVGGDGKSLTITENDGDIVTLRLSAEGLSVYDIQLAPDGSIASLDLTDRFQLSGEIDNLFNRTYYANSYAQLWVTPGAPRTFNVRATYRF